MSDKIFEKDLEFVQLLCNPDYLKWLYDQGYFEQDSFIKLIRHLEYWKEDEYKKHLTYPYCIKILDTLNSDDVLEILKDESFYLRIAEEQFVLWRERRLD